MKERKKSVGCFMVYNDTFLIMHRTPTSYGGAKWGLVGGKAEVDEKPVNSIIREIKEETGLHVSENSLTFVDQTTLEYPDTEWDFSLFRMQFSEKPTITLDPKEHQAFLWVTLGEATARKDLMPGLYILLDKFRDQIFQK